METERQMGAVARQVVVAGRLAVGSAGFAAALAREMGKRGLHGGRQSGQVQNRDLPEIKDKGRVGVVVGSAHPVAKRQLDRLKNVLPGKGVFLLERPLRRGTPEPVLRRLVGEARVLEKGQGIRRWVVTGGETAFAMARVWKEPRWRLVGKIEPGVPLCRSLGKDPRLMVLKPGGFGSTDVLLKSVRRLLRKGG